MYFLTDRLAFYLSHSSIIFSHAPVCIYEAICRSMLFSHYLYKLCDEIKFEQWCLLSLMGTINLTIAQYYEFVKQAVKQI